MVRRFGVVGSAGVLLASAFVAVATLGVSAAHADSFEDWATVSAGQQHTCGIRKNGKLYCWGNDASGQVGDGDASSDPVTSPRRIGTFEDWAVVAGGEVHTCGVRKNGKLYCWGNDASGQVGDGGENEGAITSPRRVGTFEDWAAVAAGGGQTCGVRRNGKLYCWGDDTNGKVGDGDTPGAATAPRRIGTLEDWAAVAAGNSHTCGVRKNGKLYCWGLDDFGQVGDGGANSEAIASPRRIGTFEDWATVAAGSFHTCGVRTNGKLYCWGSDGSGQVGDGGVNTEFIPSPRRIGTFEDWATVAAGAAHSCGVRTNGKLYCWGMDALGQVGDGGENLPAVSTPKRIGTFEDWVTGAAGVFHSCGVRSNGKLYCWGFDNFGQRGDGEAINPGISPFRI